MPRSRPKPPAQTKAQLMEEICDLMQEIWPLNPRVAIEFLLNYFTGLDLVGIRDELKSRKGRTR